MMDKRKSVSKLPPPITPLRGGSRTSTHREKANFEKWMRHDLWRIEEAIMLLLGLEPFDVKSDYWDKPPEYDYLYKLALGSKEIGALEFHNAQQVKPSIFVEWATSKSLTVPDELKKAVTHIAQLETKTSIHDLKQLTPKTNNEINQEWQTWLESKAAILINQKEGYLATKQKLASDLGKILGIEPATIERQTRKTW